jgi:hypothetical protein
MPLFASAMLAPVSSAVTRETTWQVVASPNVGSSPNHLVSVDGVSADDVWAVGDWEEESGSVHPLIEHWDGSRWRIAMPRSWGSAFVGHFYAVTAISSDDAWAVGEGAYGHECLSCALTFHWDGVRWRSVPNPANHDFYDFLLDVTAITSQDVWAVGYYGEMGGIFPDQALALHWDGTAWERHFPPSPGYHWTNLEGVSGSSTSDVWAVGGYDDVDYQSLQLIEHWDGNSWTEVPTTPMDPLLDVASVSADDASAVGYVSPEVLAWDGTQWTVVPTPSPVESLLSGGDALGPDLAWAVGERWDGPELMTFTLRWDGSTWIVSPSPGPGTQSELAGVSIISSSDVWAVGDYWDSSDRIRTLTLHYSG